MPLPPRGHLHPSGDASTLTMTRTNLILVAVAVLAALLRLAVQGPSRSADHVDASPPPRSLAVAAPAAPALDPAGRVREREELAISQDVGGLVVGPDGRPLPGCRVALQMGDLSVPEHLLHLGHTETDVQGRYAFRGVSRGVPLVVAAEAPGFAASFADVVDGRADLALSPPGSPHGLVLDVVDESGMPVPSFSYEVQSTSRGWRRLVSRSVEGAARGRDEVILPLPSEEIETVTIAARAPGFRAAPPVTIELDLGAGRSAATVVLEHCPVLEGRVVDPSGVPVGGALVHARGEAGVVRIPATTAPRTGSFLLDEGQVIGANRLIVVAPGHPPKTVHLAPGAHAEGTLEVVLDRGAALEIVVTGSACEALEGTRCAVVIDDLEAHEFGDRLCEIEGRLDPAGRLLAHPVPVGDVTVRLMVPGTPSAICHRLTLAPNEHRRVDLHLSRERSLHGQVIASPYLESAPLLVTLVGGDPGERPRCLATWSGQVGQPYAFTTLPEHLPAELRLRIHLTPGNYVERPVDLGVTGCTEAPGVDLTRLDTLREMDRTGTMLRVVDAGR